MKLFRKLFPMALFVSMVALTPVSTVYAQVNTKTTVRDHRVKQRANTTVPAQAGSKVDSVRRDHRTTSRTNTTVAARKGSEKAKHYQLNAAGKFVPFTPPATGKEAAQAKSSVNCAIIPCPSDFQKDITCWKCQKSEDNETPKTDKAKKDG